MTEQTTRTPFADLPFHLQYDTLFATLTGKLLQQSYQDWVQSYSDRWELANDHPVIQVMTAIDLWRAAIGAYDSLLASVIRSAAQEREYLGATRTFENWDSGNSAHSLAVRAAEVDHARENAQGAWLAYQSHEALRVKLRDLIELVDNAVAGEDTTAAQDALQAMVEALS